MFTVIETLWRLVVLIGCAFLQAIAAILGGVALLFGNGCEALRKASKKILQKLNNGKYEEKMRDIAEK
jgi:hypothetical protein